MKTVCHTQLSFANIESKSVVAAFDGGKITSDGGCVLLREIDERVGVIDSINRALVDPRDPAKIRHRQFDLTDQFADVVLLMDRNRIEDTCSNASLPQMIHRLIPMNRKIHQTIPKIHAPAAILDVRPSFRPRNRRSTW